MTTASNPADKKTLRRQAYAARASQPDRAAVSEQVMQHALALPEVRQAGTVLWYIGIRTEVETWPALIRALAGEQRIVVPYCTEDSTGAPCLGLWHLRDPSELVPGTWSIPEPPHAHRADPERRVAPQELDAILVPGVAFTRQGDRMGNGAGYYDRLLPATREDSAHIGIAFECQMFDEIPTDSHDRPMHYVVTERSLYKGGQHTANRLL